MASNDPRLAQAQALHKYLEQFTHSDFATPVSEIEPGLYVGGTPTPQFPHVDAVLNVSDKVQENPKVSVITDEKTADVMFWMPIHDRAPFPGTTWLDIATDIVGRVLAEGWTILVHCDKGHSRSAMVVIAYFMKRDGLSVDDALDYVLTKRAVNPNPYFLVGLQDWETYLTTGQDVTPEPPDLNLAGKPTTSSE